MSLTPVPYDHFGGKGRVNDRGVEGPGEAQRRESQIAEGERFGGSAPSPVWGPDFLEILHANPCILQHFG